MFTCPDELDAPAEDVGQLHLLLGGLGLKLAVGDGNQDAVTLAENVRRQVVSEDLKMRI
jgi:hypothetical protein